MPSDLQTAQLRVIKAVDELTRSFGGQAWLRGGWAMDFCLGRVTRPHTDVDIYTDVASHRQTVDALVADGWDLDDRLPVDRQADLSRGGVDLSLNPIRQVSGVAVHGPGPWEGEPYPADMLEHAGRARVEGVEASYISPMAQLELKLMTRVWRPEFRFREKDEADVALLCRYMFHTDWTSGSARYAKLTLGELPGDWTAGRGRDTGAQRNGHEVRQARADDSGALAPLFDALSYPADGEAIRRRLSRFHSDASYESWVVIKDSAVIGFAAGHLVQPIEEDDPAAQLIALVTAPQHQGTGVGQALVEHFEAWALAAGARRALVSSGDHRVETHAFYLRRDYTRTGIRFGKLLPDNGP